MTAAPALLLQSTTLCSLAVKGKLSESFVLMFAFALTLLYILSSNKPLLDMSKMDSSLMNEDVKSSSLEHMEDWKMTNYVMLK